MQPRRFSILLSACLFPDLADPVIYMITSPAGEDPGEQRPNPRHGKFHPQHGKQIRTGNLRLRSRLSVYLYTTFLILARRSPLPRPVR